MTHKKLKETDIQSWLTAHIAEIRNIPVESVDIRAPFANYGLASREIVFLSGELEQLLGRRLPVSLAYEYPTIEKLAHYLENIGSHSLGVKPAHTSSHRKQAPDDVAVVGMACRFPGAPDLESFWDLLEKGGDAVSDVPRQRWNSHDYFHPDPSVPGKSVSEKGGFLSQIDQFDPYFFGISPVEAEQMDPQQRLLMELSYEALEDAGQLPDEMKGSATGVFVGISVNEYGLRQFVNPYLITSHTGTGGALSVAANRISYFYDLKGPSLAIDTACSSSLSAVHLACQAIRNGECGIAIAGGVNLMLSPAHSIAFTKAGVLSPDGCCKSFDAAANGYVRGEGGGLLILKPLSSALENGDRIYALIAGGAMSQDGHTNGLMAPNPESQAALLRTAYHSSGISPASISYVEAHGTGTLLGDEMEARSIGSVIGRENRNGTCKIGSVKSNIGHLEAAAGIAGLIKVILSVQHRILPPSIHYENPNPHIDFEELGLEVVTKPTPWLKGPVVAGVNSFGFGGTNVHLIVKSPEEVVPVEATRATAGRSYQLLPVSARNPETLQQLIRNYEQLLAREAEVNLADLCYTASVKRNHFEHRAAFMASSTQEMQQKLQEYLENTGINSKGVEAHPKVAFVFPGQGGQWQGMARELISQEPVFKNEILKCDHFIHENYGWSLLEWLQSDELPEDQRHTGFIQPALFSIQVSLAALLKSWNIVPDAVAGHSMGEVAAFHTAGMLSLEDALKVICLRSDLISGSGGEGTMIVTELSEDEAERIVGEYGGEVSIAALNGPSSTVLSGDPAKLGEIQVSLLEKDLFCQPVNVNIASHSIQMDKYRKDLLKLLADIRPVEAKIPVYSTVTGEAEETLVCNADYWVDNLRQPVRFHSAVRHLAEHGNIFYMELGPHPVLLGSIRQTLLEMGLEGEYLACMQREDLASHTLYNALGRLYELGFAVNWKNVYACPGHQIRLPAYPWQRKRYWIEAGSSFTESGSDDQASSLLLGNRIHLASSPGIFLWQATWDTLRMAYLEDHKIGGQIVIPAAAFIELAFQAAREAEILATHDITDFMIQEMTILPAGESLSVQTELRKGEDGIYHFAVHRRNAVTEAWTRQVTAKMRLSEPKDDAPDIRKMQDGTPVSGDALYQNLSNRGLNYGPSFQVVRKVWPGDTTALGEISLPSSLAFDAPGYTIHPVLLDGCLQTLAATDASENLYLPTACERMHWYTDAGSVCYCQVCQMKPADERTVRVNLRLLNEDQQLAASLTGLTFKLMTGRQRIIPTDLHLYKTHWEEETGASAHPSAGDNYLILSDEDAYAGELDRMIRAVGGRSRTVNLHNMLPPGNAVTDEMLSGIMERILDENGVPDKIVHLSACCPGFFIDRENSYGHRYWGGVNSLLFLVRVLLQRNGKMPEIVIVTRGSQCVLEGEQIHPVNATLWGLGRVINFELPQLECRMIDLDPKTSPQEAITGLYALLERKDSESYRAIRNSKNYVMRISRFAPSGSPLISRSMDMKGTYVITGGLGDLGLETAVWLAGMGAEHLVLLGRNHPTKQQQLVCERIREQGSRVTVYKTDISKYDKVRAAFGDMASKLPPVRGVIHAAGVLDDAALGNLGLKEFEKVFAPKVEGTLNIHQATLDQPLEFFILFSSAVSVLGSPGQGNYAAACAFMDSFAFYRRSQGLPALSINWGPWAEVGLAARSVREKEETAPEHMIKAIAPDQGIKTLHALMHEPVSQVAVLPFDLGDLLELYPLAARMPYFRNLLDSGSYVVRKYRRPALGQEYIAPRDPTEAKLAELLERTLHIDRVGIRDSFFELGGDSVLAAQILTSVQKSFGVRISLKGAFKAFTIEKLAIMVKEALLERIEGMTEEEVREHLKDRS